MRSTLIIRSIFCWFCVLYCFLAPLSTLARVLKKKDTKKEVAIVIGENSHARIRYGAERIVVLLSKEGYRVTLVEKNKLPKKQRLIIVGLSQSTLIQEAISKYHLNQFKTGKEGFTIKSVSEGIIIAGDDFSGALYGCLELEERIKLEEKIPDSIGVSDKPEMVLRGTCLGLQKPYYLPGRTVYEYPYTPESFPWFYDKEHWIKYLDMMVENRYNSLYLWNGHPFASLVRLKDYPYAVEVVEATFKKNEEMFSFLTQEADRRGIWVLQMFYNIIVSKPFAEKNNLKTQDRNRPKVPLIADYTRKSVEAFVLKYPNVGLLITLGEAMEEVGQDDIDWFTKTIIPGVQDGLRALGKTTEPPIVLRVHDTDAPAVMKSALPLYKNLYTMAKYNGEALTTYTPRGSWAELQRSLSRIGTVHIQNVHILANLEPFRYSSPDFIQKSVLAMHNIYQSNGLHLFPQASYWDWPYTADKRDQRLLQVDRDWMWYKAWGRYAWKSDRKRNDEIAYWTKDLAKTFGTDNESARLILRAQEEVGEISPKLLRRYGITDGNRQTMTLGMLLTQLINPFRYNLFTRLYESEGPEGEMIIEYAEKEWKKEKHIGETPVQIAEEVVVHGKNALEAIEKAATSVTQNKEEFDRLKNDIFCYNSMANFYSQKAKAAILVLKYSYSADVEDLENALPYLERSLDSYSDLVKFTQDKYLYANSMQTGQRKIPVSGEGGKYKKWDEMMPVYQKELTHFKHAIDSLKKDRSSVVLERRPYKMAEVKLLSDFKGFYTVTSGQNIFVDSTAIIKEAAVELGEMKAIRLSRKKQSKEGTSLRFTSDKPVKLLVGYFIDKDPLFAKAPELETDASANDYGQEEIKISNAIHITGMPKINVHSYTFKSGTHQLNLPKGILLLLGFVDAGQAIKITNAGLGDTKKNVDWLFE